MRPGALDAQANLRRLDQALSPLPVVAILRGVRSEEAIAVVEALFAAGVRVAEVPLNSPQPFVTIRALVAHFGERMVLGGGTVTSVEQVRELAACGAALCVAPNTDAAVIAAALAAGMVPMPGFQTPSEAFVAVAAGATRLKLFPAAGRASDLAALRTVLPREVQVFAVGGVNAFNCDELAAAGAAGFGIGGELYRPGMDPSAVGERAAALLPHFGRAALARKAVALCNPHAVIGEAPLWHAASGRIVWTDPMTRRLLQLAAGGAPAQAGMGDMANGAVQMVAGGPAGETALADSVWSLAALPDGSLAATLAHGLCRLDPASGAILAGPAAPLAPGVRLNDMAVDARGGIWAGAMHGGLLAGSGALYYAATLEQAPRLVAAGLGVPNGMAFSADGATLYVVDTLARTLLAYRADVAAGGLSEPLIVTDFMGLPGKPDGMTLGPDGNLWVAMWGGSCVVAIAPGGALLRRIPLPAPHVSSACFGPDGTLFVSTSRMRLAPRQLEGAPGSGGLFAIRDAAGA